MPDNVTIYARDRRAITEEELATAAPGAQITVDINGVVVAWGKLRVNITDKPEGELPEHLTGLAGFLGAAGAGPVLKERGAATRQMIGCVINPGFDEEGKVTALMVALAAARRGFLVTRDGFYNPAGDQILDESQIDKAMATRPSSRRRRMDSGGRPIVRMTGPLTAATGPTGGRTMRETGDFLVMKAQNAPPPPPKPPEHVPPTMLRVARRALVLAAVVLRARMEPPPDSGNALWTRLRAWFGRHDLHQEAEAHEVGLIVAPLGGLTEREAINATWQAEGMAVLAADLGVARLPPHDENADPFALARKLGVLDDSAPPAILAAQPVMDLSAREKLGRQLLGIHWRLREFALRPIAMDFRTYARQSWAGSFELDEAIFAGDDLAIGGKPIAEADPQQVRMAHHIADERHHAINWLLGDDAIYSKVKTPT